MASLKAPDETPASPDPILLSIAAKYDALYDAIVHDRESIRPDYDALGPQETYVTFGAYVAATLARLAGAARGARERARQ